jgi:hypothetical protein
MIGLGFQNLQTLACELVLFLKNCNIFDKLSDKVGYNDIIAYDDTLNTPAEAITSDAIDFICYIIGATPAEGWQFHLNAMLTYAEEKLSEGEYLMYADQLKHANETFNEIRKLTDVVKLGNHIMGTTKLPDFVLFRTIEKPVILSETYIGMTLAVF